MIQSKRLHLEQLRAATTLTVRQCARRQVVALTRKETNPLVFDRERDRQIVSTEAEIQFHETEIQRLIPLVTEWERKPLRSTDELVAAQREARRTTQVARNEERDRRYWLAVNKLRDRIDRAVQAQNSGTLAEIWTSSFYGLRDKSLGRTIQQVLNDVGRPHVWAAFGLPVVPGTRSINGKDPWEWMALELMKDRQCRIKRGWVLVRRSRELRGMLATWPATLGGEDANGLRTLTLAREHYWGLVQAGL